LLSSNRQVFSLPSISFERVYAELYIQLYSSILTAKIKKKKEKEQKSYFTRKQL